ncbi:hypothetical protein [Arcobacter sp.]|uniref:hypothetical protein n=1 Tax=Arcobacter sp. TaxID=1872629 RepID=UPI003D11C1CD
MYIKYTIYNKNTEDERHYMKIEGTGINVCGLSKESTFDQLKRTLNCFITDLKQLRQVEIGNIQETQTEALSFDAQMSKIDREIIKKVVQDEIEEINKDKFRLIESILEDNFDNCPIELYKKIKQAIRFETFNSKLKEFGESISDSLKQADYLTRKNRR